MSKMIKIYTIILLIQIVFLQKHKEFKLDTVYKGTLKSDDSYEYYKLEIPEGVKNNTKSLVFVMKEDQTDIKKGAEIFSDPDIIISKTKPYPKLFDHSGWQSEQYGNDIISISSNHVKTGEIFYIAMYCQFPCHYIVSSYLAESTKINIGSTYMVNLKKGASINYYFTIPDIDYNELNIIASSPLLNEFKIFVEKDSPSSVHTYPLTPSWAGGYICSIAKSDTGKYCKNCSLQILLEGNDKYDSIIQIYAYFREKEKKIIPSTPIYDFGKTNNLNCYAFDIDKSHFINNQEIIIQLVLFSGSDILYVNGYNPTDDRKQIMQKITESSDNYIYKFKSSITLHLKKNDLEIFENNTINKNSTEDYERRLHFCVLSDQTSSYVLTANYLNEVESTQKHNFLLPNNEIYGYMQKEQTTSYKVIDYTHKKNIKIMLYETQGKVDVYLYYCIKSNCYFTKNEIEKKLKNDELILPENPISNRYDFNIPKDKNKCALLDLPDNEKLLCNPLIVVHCKDSDICKFRIQMQFQQNPILMQPATSYYGIITPNSNDLYDLIVDDDSVLSIVVVLSSASGDAQIFAFKYKDDSTKQLVGVSYNNAYVADIIRITGKNSFNRKISGRYQIIVFTKIFSSYNLYYYLTYPRSIKPKESDVTSILYTGEVVKDIFPLNQEYKIYSFKPSKKEDIKISIKNQNLKFSFRVYLNLSDIKYDDSVKFHTAKDRWLGYQWRSGYNDELYISANDSKFVVDSNYYILVVKNFTSNNYTSDDISATFYISVSTISKPLQLNEGIEHSATLKMEYPMQKYYYTHYNYMVNPFELNLEIFSGVVNVYINISDIDVSLLNNRTSLLRSSHYISLPICMVINPSELIGKCRSSLRCELSILIEKATVKDANYLIVAKSSEKSLEMLTSGVAKTGKTSNNIFKYYYVEEMTKRKATTINVYFKEGSGELYVRIPKVAEKKGNMTLPNATYYDYKGVTDYGGVMVQIPAEVYNRISETNPKIQIIIGIRANDQVNSSKQIEYVISYSSDLMKISQNYPKKSFININEIHYYELYFEKGTKNIYISLSNMNGGDADLLLNYGLQHLPTLEQYDWISNNAGHEFLSINENDKFFIKNNITDIGGYYSLMILGYINTSYTLFVSSGDSLIFPIVEGSPITCRCQKKGDKCYFNYNNFDAYFNDNTSDSINILITTHYYYGRGLLYSKLVDGDEFYSQGENAISLFPTKDETQTRYHFSNQFLSYISLDKKTTKFNANSLLLVTLECQMASAIDVAAAETDYKGNEFYIDAEKQNTFLFNTNSSKYLYFYNFREKNLLYQMRAIFGKANVLVYVNDTTYDHVNQKFVYNYIHLSSFILHAKRRSYSEDQSDGVILYQNTIKNTQMINQKTITYKITPLTEKFAFFTVINFSYKWMELSMNNPNTLMMEKEGFKGYFDIQDDYSQVELNLGLDEKVGKIGVIFVKVNYLRQHRQKDAEKEEDAYGYSVPSHKNYDYRAVTDKVLGTASIKLTNFKRDNTHSRYKPKIRVLVAVNIRKYKQNETDENENEFDIDYEGQMSENTKFQITLNPKIEGEQYLSNCEQQNYYYTSDVYNKKQNTVKIFNLMTNSEDDNIMVIEISSCNGEYKYTINEVINNIPTKTVVEYSVSKNGGREIITLTNLKSRNYQIKVYPINNKPICLIDNPPSFCNNIEVNYLLYYYSTNSEQYRYSLTNVTFNYQPYKRGGIKIVLPKLKEEDAMGNQRQVNDIKYDVFISESADDFEKMNSVCFLSRSSKTSNLVLYKHIKNKKGNIYISGLKAGAPYYVNVLAENTKTKEMINFHPMLVYSGTFFNSFPAWMIVTIIILIIGLIISVVFYYLKYKKTKKILNYERNDIQSMAAIPKTEAELSDLSRKENEVHYSHLTLDSQKI